MKKQINIECGNVRKVVNIDTEADDTELVLLVDTIDIYKVARPIDTHIFVYDSGRWN